MLRAVLDANVIVSATISPKGLPAQLLAAWRRREWSLVISSRILDDVQRVLRHPKISQRYAIEPPDIVQLVRILRDRAVLAAGRLAIPRTARDPDDDNIFACAVKGEADYIVTGDRDLLSLERFREIPIVTPARFAALLAASR